MASIFQGMVGGPSGLGGGLLGGILDLRASLDARRQSFLDRLLRPQELQRAQLAGGQVEQGLGYAPIELENLAGPGTEQISAGRGLLADPRFQDNATELQFAADLMKSPSTSQLGQSLLGTIIGAQQQADLQAARDADTAEADLARDALAQANKNRDTALALRDDAVRELGPIVEQLPAYQAALDVLASGSPTDAVATIFQFMQTLEPGGIVREGEQGLVRGAGGIFSQLANQLNAVSGQGMTPQLRRQLAQTMNRIMKPRIEAAQTRQGQLREAARMAQVGEDFVPLAAGNFGDIALPGLPAALQGGPVGGGGAAAVPVPAGYVEITPPGGRRARTRRERRGG